MSNSYFQFRKFRIDQGRSAMKVSTDACILGAYSPVPLSGNILDIGTGTSLLALMIAQRSGCDIEGVEWDHESFLQAAENIMQSPWSDRIHLYHADIRQYSPIKSYDLIICNPPFFENHLKSPSEKKNKAKHADQLSMNQLINTVVKLLSKPGGKFSVLLPVKESQRFLELAEKNNLYPQQQLLIRDNPLRRVIRAATIFSFERSKLSLTTLTIKDGNGKFSKEFIELLSPFYLYL